MVMRLPWLRTSPHQMSSSCQRCAVPGFLPDTPAGFCAFAPHAVRILAPQR
jgi:hypothetical protein